MKCVCIKVTGKVQGVFFRASTKDQAEYFGIKGFVRNERDGSVYIEAEGDSQNLDQFIEWCRRGPSRAVVTSCSVDETDPKGFTSFTIIR
jgi:acylphosphatase